ncbi:MAG: bifunctional glycosyltransferase family 2/GtrA family protein [Oscillospiraceae bacterium]
MDWIANVPVIIPALNPDEKLIKLIKELNENKITNIVIVNDGSCEETEIYFNAAEKLGCTILKHCTNMGKGRALKTAFNYCLNANEHLIGVVTADADGQHTVEDIVACAAALADNRTNLIMGCRNFEGEDVPKTNKMGNKLTAVVMKLLCGVQVSDTQTGLRAIPANFMRQLIKVNGEGFEFETNMLLETQKTDTPISEVPIKTVYIEQNRTSHFNPLKDSIKIYALFLKFICASVSSAVVDMVLFAIFVKLFRRYNIEMYIVVATVAARILSAIFNYFVNSKAVFEKQTGKNTMAKYALLCIVQMSLSAVLVSLVYSFMQFSELAIKIPVDLILFLISFQIQRKYVFKDNGANRN